MEIWTLIGHIEIALDATKPLLLSFGRNKLPTSSIVATVVVFPEILFKV